jgi:hypothetical protein
VIAQCSHAERRTHKPLYHFVQHVFKNVLCMCSVCIESTSCDAVEPGKVLNQGDCASSKGIHFIHCELVIHSTISYAHTRFWINTPFAAQLSLLRAYSSESVQIYNSPEMYDRSVDVHVAPFVVVSRCNHGNRIIHTSKRGCRSGNLIVPSVADNIS